jgi:hypothetical protein
MKGAKTVSNNIAVTSRQTGSDAIYRRQQFTKGWQILKGLPIEGLIIDRMERNEKLVTRYLNDPEFQEVLFRVMAQRIYDEVRGVGDDAGMVRAE